jgi:DNA primase small subunit
VCVPIKPEECEAFNPMTVPTLLALRKEMIEYDKSHPNEQDKRLPEYKKTSLKPYIEYFDKHVKSMLNETIKEKRGNNTIYTIFVL